MGKYREMWTKPADCN